MSDINSDVMEQANALQNTAALMAQSNADQALVNQLLGQAQMADSFAKFSVTVTTSKLAHVKEHKLYRALSGQESGNGYQLKGTWEEFCNLLGISREKADTDIANLKSFGEEALESMSRMGIGYREMRQFRRLPEDSKQALIEVAKAGDRESFVELAEEIISKHSKEKAALQKQLDDSKADYEALSGMEQKRSAELKETRLELQRATRRLQDATPDEAEHQIKMEVNGVVIDIQKAFKGKLAAALQTLEQHGSETGSDQRLYMATLVKQMELELLALRDRYDLPDVIDPQFDMLSDDALQQAEAAVAQMKEQAEV